MEFGELAALCGSRYHVISLVGAGGKTTLMYALSEACSRRGCRVIAGTTTHIAVPLKSSAKSESEVYRLWQEGCYAVVGEEVPGQKLIQLPEQELKKWTGEADVVFLEADGSKQMPCKVPESHEPVIVPESDLVIGVLGMSCMGKRMKECCFRLEKAKQWLPVEDDTLMSEELAVRILSSELGTRKSVGSRDYVVVLNQCDTEELREQAERIAIGLEKEGIRQVCCGAFGREG